MSKGVSLKDFRNTFEYTTTKSGPVTPARTASISMMKGTLGPVGDQTKEDFDHRTYENKSLLSHKNYLSMKDIGVKFLTEATSTARQNTGIRINLDGIDFNETSMHGEFDCDGQHVDMNMKYPTPKGEITVELALSNDANTFIDVSPDSDQFRINFSQFIFQQARELIARNADELRNNNIYGGEVIKSPGNNFNDTLNIATNDPNSITTYESVDWRLHQLRNLCEMCALNEADDFGAADFAAPADGSAGTGDGNAATPPPAGDGTDAPQNAGQVNGVSDGNGKGEEKKDFAEYAQTAFSQAALDGLSQIVADGLSDLTENGSAGAKLSAKEWREGFPGVDKMIASELVEQFLAFDEFKALGEQPLPVKGLQEMGKALEEGNVDVVKFKTNLGKWFPEVYNADGTAMHDTAKEAASTIFPADDQTGVGGGLSPDESVDLNNPGEMGDMMDNAQNQFGKAAENVTNPGVDMNETGETHGGSGNQDKTDFSLGGLGNIF